MRDQSPVVASEACPECVKEGRDSAADNLVTFESGVQYCVAGHGVSGKVAGKREKAEDIIKPESANLKPYKYTTLHSRKISAQTCKFYSYGVNDELQCHVANYCDINGLPKMQQLRSLSKSFTVLGDANYSKTLWGMHLFTPDPRVFITITEGQIDALSVAEAFNSKYPVVSLPLGAAGAEKVISQNLKYLEGFKYVVFAFDNDEAGHTATEKCLRLLGPGKVRVAHWRLKDANDLKVLGLDQEIRETIYNAVEYIPAPILTGDELVKSLNGHVSETKAWPWKSANNAIQPIKIPAVYSIVAKPQVGKTEFVSCIIRDAILQGDKIGIISLEQTIQQVILKVASDLSGQDLCRITNRKLTPEEIAVCSKAAQHLVVYDHITYGSDLKTIVSNIPYIVKSLGCKVVIFDNLSYSATTIAGDERRGIDQAMIALKDSTVKNNFTLINVCHLKRDDLNLSEEDAPVSVESIRGSQGVEMYSDYILGLHRDKSSEDILKRNTLSAYVLKDRMTGQDTGKKFTMYYNEQKRVLEDFK